jgi:hypothetical protein
MWPCLTCLPATLLLLQVLAAALLLGASAVGLYWYANPQQQQHQQPRKPSHTAQLLTALDREAANSTGRYWFGDSDPTAAGASQQQEIPRAPPKA